MSLASTLRMQISGTYKGAGDLAVPSAAFGDLGKYEKSLASGTLNDQADLYFSDTRTIAASGSENIDLAGALVDMFGTTLTFVEIVALKITAAAANANNVVIGAAGSNPWTGPLGGTSPTITLPPGAGVMLANPTSGWGVTAGTGDLLKVANSGAGTAVTYNIEIVGRSA